jgi:hypothetical protein
MTLTSDAALSAPPTCSRWPVTRLTAPSNARATGQTGARGRDIRNLL